VKNRRSGSPPEGVFFKGPTASLGLMRREGGGEGGQEVLWERQHRKQESVK